jgi:hypothetical protein
MNAAKDGFSAREGLFGCFCIRFGGSAAFSDGA